MAVKLYNTLTRKKQIFKPIKKTVGLYTCGPTVYNWAHLGNLRTYIFEDILRRVLKYNNYKVKHVMNITDVSHLTSDADTGEDKMMIALKREKKRMDVKSIFLLADFYTKAFQNDLKKLNICQPDIWCKATAHVKQMIEMIKKIAKNGYTYETESALYFDTVKFPFYGRLTEGNPPAGGKKTKSRIEKRTDKKHLADFVLWFKAFEEKKKHLLQWDSPWGRGWPGWHIECAAMSVYYLGQPFDIHCGGIDHIPVHHNNEIAQAEAANKKKMANFWLHGAFLVLKKTKMAKSTGFVILKDVLDKQINPLACRYFCLNAHYQTPLVFSWPSLKSAQNALNKLYQMVSFFGRPAKSGSEKYEKKFLSAINNNLNTPQALAIVWQMIKDKAICSAKKMSSLIKFDQVLGLDIEKSANEQRKISSSLPEKIVNLVEQRKKARKEKNWSSADQLRKKIQDLGYQLEDTEKGIRIKPSV